METRKKKVLYAITKSNLGGAQRYVYDLATSLPKDQYDVVVVLGGSGRIKDMLEDAGIRVISFEYWQRDIKLIDELRSLFALRRLFRTEKPDVVHVNSSKVGGLGSVAARLAGVPKIIFTAHGWPFNEKRGALWVFAARFFSWLTVLFAHKTIIICQRDLAQGKQMVFARNKLTLIPIGIPSFPLQERAEARGFLIPGFDTPERIWVGAIGELHPNKGYTYAFEGISLLLKERPDMNLIFVVIGEGDQREYLGTLVRELGIEKNVHFAGNPHEARQYLRAFDVFLMTSIKEGLPYVILEAGHAHLPVVASSTGGIPDVIADRETGVLIKPGDAKEVTRGLAYIIDESAKRALFAEGLHENVEQGIFSLSHMLTETRKLY